MQRLFAIGDIHGCFDSLKELVESKIKFTKEDKLVLLGDYIDRGHKAKEVVDYIIGLQAIGYDVIPLMGNHEVMLLEAFDDDENVFGWKLNGGNHTLKSFGIRSVKELPIIYVEFFRNLAYYYSFENFLFVHAGFNDKANNPFEDKYSMIWNRYLSYSNPLLIYKTIIHGHRPVTIDQCKKQIENNNAVIDIDTGCVYKNESGCGKLSAIELPSMVLYSI